MSSVFRNPVILTALGGLLTAIGGEATSTNILATHILEGLGAIAAAVAIIIGMRQSKAQSPSS